ncbi:MAG: hypothetical protein AABX16_01440 [Nanoarchaeota archaeon]
MKRQKRLEKGIESLQKQIEIHKDKLNKAKEDGNEDLVKYYEKDITNLENEKNKKREKQDKL